MSLRNNLKNHLKVYGPDGLHSWNGGYDVNDDLPIHKIARAARRNVEPGDVLVIRDNNVIVEVEKVLGVFLMFHLVRLFLRNSCEFSEKPMCLLFPDEFASDFVVTEDQH